MLLIKLYADLINESLKKLSFSKTPESLYDPIKYILEIGGKRIRHYLVLMSTSVFGADPKLSLNAALSVECFHNFTLMHDDIMDSAPLRRGNETVHLKWDINQSILSGDALLIYSYKLLDDYNIELLLHGHLHRDSITYLKTKNSINEKSALHSSYFQKRFNLSWLCSFLFSRF